MAWHTQRKTYATDLEVIEARKTIDNSLDNIAIRVRELIHKSKLNDNSMNNNHKSCEHYLK